ncbi:MAG: hypothetical protein C0622_09865 [Desulfuromonas sp.]|nr:MAG: hypothetical protein C0622_09865 [Desulfuromonas sp.]
MRASHILALLLCCLTFLPQSLLAETVPPDSDNPTVPYVAPAEPMASSSFLIQGGFASALSTQLPDPETTPDYRMVAGKLALQEGGFGGSGVPIDPASRTEVLVKVEGMETGDALTVKQFEGFPGFFPAVSPTSIPYSLDNPPLLAAPNVIYLPYEGDGNLIRYVLTGYTGTGAIPSGSPDLGMRTIVPLMSPLSGASTITWNYKKQVRVAVVTFGEEAPLTVYDFVGDTKVGSHILTNIAVPESDSLAVTVNDNRIYSLEDLTPGMSVYGNGIPEGTVVTAVNAEVKDGNGVVLEKGSVSLSNPVALTLTQGFPNVGQTFTFARTLEPSSSDPRECFGSDVLACVADEAAPSSGVQYYDADPTSSVVLTVAQQFNDLDIDATLKSLAQTQIKTYGTGTPIKAVIDGKQTVTVFGLEAPLVVRWSYSKTRAYVIGSPMLPPKRSESETPVDESVPPLITLEPPATLESAFVSAWDNADWFWDELEEGWRKPEPGQESTDKPPQGLRYFPLQPLTAFNITWTCTDGETYSESARAIWPEKQKHIVGVPVNLHPIGNELTYKEISSAGTSGASVSPTAEFNATAAGTSILRFDTPAKLPDLKIGATFIVVQSEEKPADVSFDDATSCVIGEKIPNYFLELAASDPDAPLPDPEYETKTGYLYYPGGVHDGEGPDRAYDRSTRKGAIIPVNKSSSTEMNPLVVVWYEKGEGGIGWPTEAIRYRAEWPDEAPSITIGTGIPVSPTAKPQAMVYNQPDPQLTGFNPNEEHALLTGDTLYALRNDLNVSNNKSASYVLLKYFDTVASEWAMDVYQVARPESFVYEVEAGQPIVPPLPGSFQVPPKSGIKKIADVEVGGEWHFEDRKGGHWAKAANWRGDEVPAVAEADRSRFVMQWYYYLRPDFYWPYDAAEVQDGVPFLNNSGGDYDGFTESPIDVTYVTRWPESAPSLKVGDTLTSGEKPFPDLYNWLSAEVVFDENVYRGGGPLAKLYAPERYLYVVLKGVPAGIKTDVGTGGVTLFPELPFVIQRRLFYDGANQRLGFKGEMVSLEGENSWLLPNLMTGTARETIKELVAADAEEKAKWDAAVDALYALARNPNNLTDYPDLVGCSAGEISISNPYKQNATMDACQWGIPLGLENDGGKIVSARSILGEKNALSAGMAQGTGYVVLVENNDPALGAEPVALHVLQVSDEVYQGKVMAIKSKNVFDEKLTLHYMGDFGGEPEKFFFEWIYQPVANGQPSLPQYNAVSGEWVPDLADWSAYVLPEGEMGMGANDITIEGASPLTLSDNWFSARYYYKEAWPTQAEASLPVDPAPTPHDDLNNWSGWSGASATEPVLALGWIKRVVDGLNPLEARVTDFRNSPTNTTVSMLSQFGERYAGDVALNGAADNLNGMGLISAYETVLNRGRLFSIDATPPQDYGPTNDALLNISSRLATFYLALGNEAYADAVDPTIGFSTMSAEYGNMAPSIFAFQNQVDSLLDEELVLLRGRDDTATSTSNSPYYNRLIWNFTQGEGEVAYAQNYNVTDQDESGLINAADARIMYPQGHGDAWGHYLQAISYYYRLLGHSSYSWEPRAEFVMVAGNPIMVDYLDERKFASIAAARAKTGAEVLDLTYRKFFTDDPSGQWQGYKDTYVDRAWGVDEWARRAAHGAYFDWLTANAILPDSASATPVPRKRYVEDPATGTFTEEIIPENEIQQIDRSKVPEITTIASQFQRIQSKMEEVDSGVNPLGLVKGVVPFDIDPVQISAGKTHFEQIYERAEEALANAISVYDYANGYTQRLRQNQDTLETFKKNLNDQERDYTNRLIEIFGYPYEDDIGAGKTYPDGYDGPDILHFNYVDRSELTGDVSEGYKTFTTTISDPGVLENLVDMGAFSEKEHTVEFNISSEDTWVTKPEGWLGKRKAPGKVQQALSELLVARASYEKSYAKFDGMVADIESAKDDLQARYDLSAKQVFLMNTNYATQTALDATIGYLHAQSTMFRAISEGMDEGSEIVIEGMPKSMGLSSDVTAPIRGTIKGISAAGKEGFDAAADVTDNIEFNLEKVKERVQAGTELTIEKSNINFELKQQYQALENMLADVDQQLLETYLLKEEIVQAAGKYQAVLAEGLSLLDERAALRAQSAAEVQEYRFQDLGFRVFRNDAIQKYRAQFELAARYVYLAATAYDYETNLLGTEAGSGRKFLSDIVRQSSIGVLNNGTPMAGFPGLADIMARLSQNFEVYKTQLGFNNPQTETTPFSLRTELFRVKSDAESDQVWRDVLKDHRVENLWEIPEYKAFCRPFAPESAGPQPGLVFRFPTYVTYGKNFFGWPLSGGDSAYSSSNFATRVRSVGVWFKNYDSSGLSSTPRVYLVPVGADVLRSPSGDGFATREWQVRDQVLPVPFPIGDSDLKDPEFIPINDSLSGEFSGIRRVSDFRAYPYSGSFNPTQTASDSRLIGRSVWNTDWMMIIPASTLLFNKDVGLETFINSVDDIKMFFQTYAFSGN